MNPIDLDKRPPGYTFAESEQIPEKCRRAFNAANRDRVFPLYVFGGVGTGKTCAAAVMFGAFRSPLWFRADDLLMSMSFGRSEGIRVAQGRNTTSLKWSAFVALIESPRHQLILDDLGVRKPTEAMQASLFDLFEWRAGLPFLITSNKSPEELAGLYDDRIRSRILAGTICPVDGPDRRRGKGYRFKPDEVLEA